MLLISREINLILTWSANCIICEVNKATTFAITDTKLYVPVITLSIQGNIKLLQQLKSGLKRSINLHKCQANISRKKRLEII